MNLGEHAQEVGMDVFAEMPDGCRKREIVQVARHEGFRKSLLKFGSVCSAEAVLCIWAQTLTDVSIL